MQQDTTDLHRHQLVDALHQCGHQLRNTAAMLDSYAAVLQNVPHASLPMQNMFQMFTPPQSGAVGPVGGGYAAHPANGVPVPPAATPARGRKRRDVAEFDQDETGKKKGKREKKERDPNAPKRPPSAYLLFQNEVREETKKQFPGIPYVEVLNKISERWANMTDEQKKAYTDTTNEMRAKFEVEKAAYESSHGPTGQNGTAAAALAASATTSPSAPAPAPALAASVPTAPAPVPPPAQATKPTTDKSPEDEFDEEEDGASEASAALAKESSTSTTSISSSSESDETSSDENDGSSKRPPPSKKKTGTEIEKPASTKAKKQQTSASTPAKKGKGDKGEKENKKERKSKKD